MRMSKTIEIPNTLKNIWITNLPNFSITKCGVLSVETRKNGDLTIRLEANSGVYEDMIVAKLTVNPARLTDHFKLKKSYHLTESEAAIRLRDHFRALSVNHVVAKRVAGDTTDKDQLDINIEKFMDDYPEMTI